MDFIFKREKELMLLGLEPNEKSYKGVWLFLLVYFGATFFASVLTSPTYCFVEWLHSVLPSSTTEYLLGKRLDIYFNRLRYLPILIGIPYMMKELGLFSVSNLGLKFEKKSLIVFAKYFVIGLILAFFVFLFQFIFYDVSYSGKSVGKVVSIIFSSVLSAIIVGLLEEVVFRSLVFRSLYTAFTPVCALVATSLFFAYKHFRVPSRIFQSLKGDTDFDVGFLVAYYDSIGIFETFSASMFISLTIFGAVLTLIYMRTKNLWAAVATHSGIVFLMLSYKKLFSISNHENFVWLFGTNRMTDGISASLILIIFLAIFIFVTHPKDKC